MQTLERPEISEAIEMYSTARENLVNFRRVLLASSDEGEVNSPQFHYDWSNDLLHGTTNKAIEGFRESAKTQYVLRAFPLYCLTFPSAKRDYVVIIKNNATLAANKLKEIEREYITNPLLKANLVKINVQSGDAFDIDVRDSNGKIINVRIEAYGKGASVRGLSFKDRRPKIIIIDDPQDIDDAKSDTIVKNDWDWFTSDVVFLGKKSRIFMIGNNLGERCIIERVFANADKLKFEVERQPIMDNEGNSSWPEMFSEEFITQEKEDFRDIGKIDTWLRERMCVALSEETQVFNKRDIMYFEPNMVEHIIKGCKISATLDPASSTELSACFRAIVINAITTEDHWNIVDVPYGRWDSVELVDKIFEVVVKYKLRDFHIEKGMLEQTLGPFIYKEMPKRKVYFNLIPLEHAKAGTKLERIKLLAPRFKAHTIWFPRYAPWLTEMITEMAGVTKDLIKSLFIDLVDALAMQEQCSKGIPHRSSVAKTKHPKGRV